MLTRVDKRKDRVEISSEQLVSATTKAENITKETGIQSRVIGWYHSHPHISPWPSHVDLNSQSSYQMMEKGFIGLIFSVFNQDSECKGTIEVHGFQSAKNESGDDEEIQIPVIVIPNLNYPSIAHKRMIELLDILLQEEKISYLSSVEGKSDLVVLHNSTIYQRNVTKLIEYFSVTIKKSIDSEINENLKKIEEMK
jgi:BRCA1/BRCA2-containing complex subunit 3